MTTIDLDERFAGAFGECAAALEKFFNAPAKDGETPELKRDRYVLALMALSQFFNAIDQNKSAEELLWLASALHDLKEGTTHPVLLARKRTSGGRALDSTDVWSARSKVAIGIEALRRAGKSDSIIAKRLDRRKADLAKLLRPSTNLKTAPFNWLDQLKDGNATNLIAKGRWQMFATGVGAVTLPGEQWEKLGEGMLDSAARDAGKLVI